MAEVKATYMLQFLKKNFKNKKKEEDISPLFFLKVPFKVTESN